MKRCDKLQVLTSGRVDRNGNQIPPGVIDWSTFDQNPVLRYDPEHEGHRGVVVGRVEDRQLVEGMWAAHLSFLERVEPANTAYEKYVQGGLPFVSVGGYGLGKEVDGVFVCSKYVITEVSLVQDPANLDARMREVNAGVENPFGDVKLGDDEIRYIAMSATENELNNNEMKNEEVLEAATDEVVEAAAEETVEVSTEEDTADAAVEASVEEEEVETVEASLDSLDDDGDDDETEDDDEEVEASADTPADGTQRVEAAVIPDGMEWHERITQNKNTNLMNKSFKELNCDAEFSARMRALSAPLLAGASRTDALPENAETMQILAQAMLADDRMVTLASRTHYTNDVTKVRRNALETLLECAAGNAADATLAAADLGVINWLSMFYQQMFANDTFRRSLRFVPMSDREGAIYIEDNVKAPTYVGSNTPLNAPVYQYEDIKRTIARKVFAFSPILFQHSELAILAYDKQSWGIKTTMAQLAQDWSTYVLQIIANTAGIQQQVTTGMVPGTAAPLTMNTAGLFPIEAPNSALTVNMPTRNDLIALQGKFMMQQYNLNDSKIEMVLPVNLYSALAEDPAFYNKLTRENSGNNESTIEFQAVRVTGRNPVARYNTTSTAAELDPAMYVDNITNDDGTFTAVIPATTTAQHVGAGVAFVENEVLAGVGGVELIVWQDPRNYGTMISGWFSGGATVARQNGVGAALIVPGVSA